MEKFSVKRPFTVLVAVIMVIMLGFVSVTGMQTNLLPDVNTPYLMVVTVYPGASPERVESEVSDVMENGLGNITGVERVTATSSENFSLLLMQFEETTDMNSALVKVSNKIDQLASGLPDACMTPSIIEYSLNMNAFMTAAVSQEGADIYEMSDFVSETLVPTLQRADGVSSVSSTGLVDQMVPGSWRWSTSASPRPRPSWTMPRPRSRRAGRSTISRRRTSAPTCPPR